MPSFAYFSVDTNLPVNNSISQSASEIKSEIIAATSLKQAESMGNMKKAAKITAGIMRKGFRQNADAVINRKIRKDRMVQNRQKIVRKTIKSRQELLDKVE